MRRLTPRSGPPYGGSFEATKSIRSGGATCCRRSTWNSYNEINPQTGIDLWTLSPGGPSQEGTTSPLRVTSFNEGAAQVSPGPEGGPRWVAYLSDESGRNEIYVQSYPSGANRIPVSTGGGNLPRWSRDGKELFYVTGDAIVAVAIRPDGSFGACRRLQKTANGTWMASFTRCRTRS